MNHISITVENQTLTAEPTYPLVAKTVGAVTFSVEFGSGWEDMDKILVFSTGSIQKQILVGATDIVPWEVLQDPGSLRITATGTGNRVVLPTARMRTPLKINSSGDTPEDPGYPESEQAWQQVLKIATPGKPGITPHIGENGNWFIGSEDTGYNAKGLVGDIGPAGIVISDDEPTDPSHPVWIKPGGGEDIPNVDGSSGFDHQSTDVVITVGPKGDYQSLGEALKYASTLYPTYKAGGVKVEVRILSGVVIAEQVYVVQQDLQFVTITSVYAEVLVDASGFRATADAHDSRSSYPFFAGENAAKLPTIGCLFKLSVPCAGYDVTGLLANRGSEAVVLTGCGFDGFSIGVISNNESSVTIREGICRNMTRWGVHARHNGEVSARSADLTNCNIAAYADRVADVDVREAVFDGSKQCIACYHASRVCANANGEGSADNCGAADTPLIDCRFGSIVDASGMVLTNAKYTVFSIDDGGTIIASDAVTTGLAAGMERVSTLANAFTDHGVIYDRNAVGTSGVLFTNRGTAGQLLQNNGDRTATWVTITNGNEVYY